MAVSLIYVIAYLIIRRKKTPFTGKTSDIGSYVALRALVVSLGFPLFFLGGITPPLTMLSFTYAPRAAQYVAVVELALMPFAISAIIHYGLRMVFRLRRADMGNYLDYGSITYYVSLTILVTYVVVLAAALHFAYLWMRDR